MPQSPKAALRGLESTARILSQHLKPGASLKTRNEHDDHLDQCNRAFFHHLEIAQIRWRYQAGDPLVDLQECFRLARYATKVWHDAQTLEYSSDPEEMESWDAWQSSLDPHEAVLFPFATAALLSAAVTGKLDPVLSGILSFDNWISKANFFFWDFIDVGLIHMLRHGEAPREWDDFSDQWLRQPDAILAMAFDGYAKLALAKPRSELRETIEGLIELFDEREDVRKYLPEHEGFGKVHNRRCIDFRLAALARLRAPAKLLEELDSFHFRFPKGELIEGPPGQAEYLQPQPSKPRKKIAPKPAAAVRDEAPFLAAIRADRDDDTPRLAVADWLEESGDARAEFIRVQCELAQLELDDARYPGLLDRQDDLLFEHGKVWIHNPPRIPGVAWGIANSAWFLTPDEFNSARRYFTRGFMGAAAFSSVGAYRKQMPKLVQETLISELQFERLDASKLAIAELAQITALVTELGTDWGPLLKSPYLSRLERLSIGNSSERRPAAQVADAPSLKRLRWLSVDSMDQQDLEQLRQSGRLSDLRSLSFAAKKSDVIERLAGMPEAKNLRELSFHSANTPGALAAILASKHLKRLTHLGLTAGTKFGDADLKALCRAKSMSKLRQLSIREAKYVSPDGIAEIARAPFAANLEQLSFEASSIGPSSGEILAKIPLERLRTLNLAHCSLQGKDAKALAESPHLKRLEFLELTGNGRKVAEFANALKKLPRRPQVRMMFMHG